MNKTRNLLRITNLCLITALILALPTSLVFADGDTPDLDAGEQTVLTDDEQETTGDNTTPVSNSDDEDEDKTEDSVTPASEVDDENLANEDNTEEEYDTSGEEQDDDQPDTDAELMLDAAPEANPPSPENVSTELMEKDDQSVVQNEVTVTEVASAAADANVSLVPLDESQEIIPLASNNAAETLTSGDPYFQDPNGNWIGFAPIGGTCDPIVTVCNQVSTPVQAAIDAAPSGAIIYVEKDTYTEDITIYKPLTLAGLWVGNEDFADRPTLQGMVNITADNVWLHGWIIEASNRVNGVKVTGDNVTISSNEIMNAGNGISDPDEANIYVQGADSVSIENNNIHGAEEGNGILLFDASNTSVRNNIIDNNGNSAPAGTISAGINIVGSGSEAIQSNNITNNAYGIYAGDSGHTVTARFNYFDGNTTNADGGAVITPELASPATLPTYHPHPPAPGSVPPPSVDDTIYTSPAKPDLPVSSCGMLWDATQDLGLDKDSLSYQRYAGNVWARYDKPLGGWVHWMGGNSTDEFLRRDDGSWHILATDDSLAALSNINDTNWSVLDGQWCDNGASGNLLFENCVLYFYANSSFIWAEHSSGTRYLFDEVAEVWMQE